MISEDEWQELFPERWGVGQKWKAEYEDKDFFHPKMEVDYYSYGNFISAMGRAKRLGVNNFLTEPGSAHEDNMRELAAFLAICSTQTNNGPDAFYYRECVEHERHQGDKNICLYRDVRDRRDFVLCNTPSYYPEGCRLAGEKKFPVQSYHGRGPIMLRGAYYYGLFSEFVFGNPDKLLQNPDLLINDGELGFLSAIWFWVTDKNGRPSCHRAMYRYLKHIHSWGFGHTIIDVSDGMESNAMEGGTANHERLVSTRTQFYRKYATRFGVNIGIKGEQLDTVGLE
ncbi:Endochitinase 3 [Clonorchis sinensis]|nr:Endochitinase 3 [Clonorchis sinensis]